MHLYSLYYLPSGNDALHWLAHAKALVSGVRYPMWSEGLLQYPPVPIILLGLFAKVFGDLLGVKLFGALVLGLLPVSSYVLVKKMFGERVGIIASLLVAITPAFYEMWGWGMFPNIFGFSILMLALFTVINFIEHRNLKWGIFAALMIILTMFSHHLTSIIFIAMMILWTLLSLLLKQPIKELAIATSFSVFVFVLYRVVVPSQYTLFNPDAALVLPMDYAKFLWVFKDIGLFILNALVAGYGCYLVYKKKPIFALMIISLLIASFGVTYGLPLLGIDLDQARFLTFSLLAFSIGVAYLVQDVALKIKIESMAISTNISTKSLAILIIVIAIIGVNGYTGLKTSWIINGYSRATSAGITAPLGDEDFQDLVDWIKQNTGKNDTFAAEQFLSKIIMGLGERRVLEDDDLGFLFMQGERARAIASDTLLHTNYEIANSNVRVRDQYPTQDQNPEISLYSEGNYYDAVYFADSLWQVTVTKNGNDYVVSPFNDKDSTYSAPLSVSYETPDVLFNRGVTIEKSGVDIKFSVSGRTPDVKLSDMVVFGWRPWTNNNLTDISYNGSAVTLIDGKINAKVLISNPAKVNCYLADPKYKQAGFQATFETNEGEITGEFFIPNVDSGQNNSPFIKMETTILKYTAFLTQRGNTVQNAAITSNAVGIIREYNVKYIAVLNNVTSEISFMAENGYRKVFSNELVSIYSTQQYEEIKD